MCQRKALPYPWLRRIHEETKEKNKKKGRYQTTQKKLKCSMLLEIKPRVLTLTKTENSVTIQIKALSFHGFFSLFNPCFTPCCYLCYLVIKSI